MLNAKFLLPILAACIVYYASKFYSPRSILTPKEKLLSNYDYVIVGGGSAGCVVAGRLSELENVTILVLEAGHDDLDFPMTQWVPFEQRLQLTDFDWKFETIPQEKCCHGSTNKKIKWPRGKGLGGCSAHNGAAFVRGGRHDYDRWGQAGPGWSFEDVLPYFKKLENAKIAKLKGQTDIHGYDGPIDITEPGDSALADALIEAAKKLGYSWRDDINAMGGKDEQEGYGKFPRSQRDGRRLSTAEAYLRPAALKRPNNLHVLIHAHVTKILFDVSKEGENPVARSVEFIHDGVKMKVEADQEVILSAGAVSSPQILMLSGIGPKQELEKLGIPVLLGNDAVGRNLFDHPMVPVSATVNDSSLHFSGVDPDDWLHFTLAKLQLQLFGTGQLSDSGIRHTGFLRSGLTDEPWPDLQHFIAMGALFTPYHVFNINEKGAEALYPTKMADPNRRRVGIITTLLQPHNPGEIRLHSHDPFDYPLIDPKYLHNDLDVDILARGVNISLQLMTSPELRRYDLQLAGTHAPGCENLQLWSDEYLKCYVRSMMVSVYHPIGTCRMGKKGENSVVDHKLRVHGMRNLRIIDASIFPFQVSANTNAATLMVAERGSDFVKADYASSAR